MFNVICVVFFVVLMMFCCWIGEGEASRERVGVDFGGFVVLLCILCLILVIFLFNFWVYKLLFCIVVLVLVVLCVR